MRKKIKLLTSNLKMFITDSGSSLPGMLADVNKFISKQQTNIGEFKEIYSSTVQCQNPYNVIPKDKLTELSMLMMQV